MSFPISRSSLSNALFRTRLDHCEPLAMDLSVAVRMKKHPVVRPFAAAVRSPHNMMVMPSRQSGDLLMTHGTETVLRFPQMQQLPPSP
jgi:hypothetical protein